MIKKVEETTNVTVVGKPARMVSAQRKSGRVSSRTRLECLAIYFAILFRVRDYPGVVKYSGKKPPWESRLFKINPSSLNRSRKSYRVGEKTDASAQDDERMKRKQIASEAILSSKNGSTHSPKMVTFGTAPTLCVPDAGFEDGDLLGDQSESSRPMSGGEQPSSSSAVEYEVEMEERRRQRSAVILLIVNIITKIVGVTRFIIKILIRCCTASGPTRSSASSPPTGSLRPSGGERRRRGGNKNITRQSSMNEKFDNCIEPGDPATSVCEGGRGGGRDGWRARAGAGE